jgi:hypothetical protein
MEEFSQFKGVPEQPTLVFIPLFRSWHKIKCHIRPSQCSFYGTPYFGKAWRLKNMILNSIIYETFRPSLPIVKFDLMHTNRINLIPRTGMLALIHLKYQRLHNAPITYIKPLFYHPIP